MRDPSFYVSSLLELAGAAPAERRALWRQAMAALSRASAEEGPGPLEGLHPDVLLRGVQGALEAGLVDDLDWLSPEAAGVALYTLAAALPFGAEQRELGRRVLARMLTGNAATFTAMATVMAQTGGKGLASPAVRARVALVSELPLTHGITDGPLAFALVSRREHVRDWIASPSTRSLPARRLAARILERAAGEAARRAQMGDRHGLRAFAADAVREAWQRLLADRESLVWRHVAVARGLLAPWSEQLSKEIEAGLAEGLSATEWRRAAASLAASAAVRPEAAWKTTQALVKRGLFSREDPGCAAAFVWGVPRALEAEPEVATRSLDLVLSVASPDVAEAVAELVFEYGPAKVVDRTSRRALEVLQAAPSAGDDDGAEALRRELLRELEVGVRHERPVRSQIGRALDAFVTQGALAAHARAREVLTAAQAALDALEGAAREDADEGRGGSASRRTSMAVLRDLDASLLERHILADVLKLGGSAEQVRASEDAHDALRERLAEWIVACETSSRTERASEADAPRHVTLRLRRLRALLHLLDGILGEGLEAVNRRPDGGEGAEVQRAKRLRSLWLRTTNALLEHFEDDPPVALRRTLLASVARALDALVRIGVCDSTDALLVLAVRIRRTSDFETLAEASMDPDLEHVLLRYAKFLRDSAAPIVVVSPSTPPGGSMFPPSVAPDVGEEMQKRLAAFEELANELAPEASARSEALRTALVRLRDALVGMANAPVLRALASDGEPDVVVAVETWIAAVAQMCAGARGRLDPELPTMAMAPPQPRTLSVAVARVLAGAEPMLSAEALAPAIDEVVAGLPHGIARLVAGVLWRLAELPTDRPSYVEEPMAPSRAGEQLPAWLPARRTMGGFYVHRSLGVGGTASVFVVTRSEERAEPEAERFALKVPDYNETAARSVSQEEFMRLFREEASALIMLPSHANLARFVTFDMGTKPLPILVMELVEGSTLEWVLGSRTLDMKRCLAVMDDVLAGLEAMHSVGIGHLDLKPSNVVLRRGEEGVLVDFGLAGRKIRPGCGTAPYASPEVWGVVPDGLVPSPSAADIYAFGCMAFEMLTGSVLFDAPNEVMQVTMHVSHDGNPMPMRALVANPEVGPLAEVLVPTLRRDPRHRPSAEQLRREIRSVASMVSDAAWPARLSS